jgi:phospholipid-binding lipoprotein MlaA
MMRRIFFLIFLIALLGAGYAHGDDTALMLHKSVLSDETGAAAASETVWNSEEGTGETHMSPVAPKSHDDEEAIDEEEEGQEMGEVTIADPLEFFNRAMFQFNDKLYFWVVKPVAQGYSKVVPETGRSSIKNFFSNLGFPKRFISCLFQADFSGAATELGRFVVNTVWGIGGLLDPAANKDLSLQKQNADIGQTLGRYGLGHGFYVVWPVFGPSSLRDTIDIVGEHFQYPFTYTDPWYVGPSVRACESVNSASLRIGDYEALKEAAIDPYVALRNAYAQYRQKMVQKKEKGEAPAPDGEKPEQRIFQ